jgi:CPA1 family monovalent cation:H+ antiporter
VHDSEIILGLLVVVVALAWVANRLRVPYPILLVIAGVGIAFVPHPPIAPLRPDLVFVLFLPPILYYAGTHTSWRDFRANLRPIAFLAIGLVLFTVVLVALAGHWAAGMSWGAAFVLGAIVSPTDAVAATTILQRLGVPRRIVTILEGESLVNDATALVAYQFAVAAVVRGTFSFEAALFKFVIAGVGGIGVGLLAGMLMAWLRPRARNPLIDNALSLLTPYVAYLPAEWSGLSGVLAAVTCGIYIARRLGRITTAEVRLRAYAVWDLVEFLLNGLIFILLGLELAQIARHRTPGWIWQTVLIAFVAIAARMAWVYPATYLSRRWLPRLRERDPAPPLPQVTLVAWTQMRGVVSLAAALALPLTVKTGDGFPHRNFIIFATFGVILLTLVGQGLTLPLVIRLLGLHRAEGEADESVDEETMARYLAALAALERLDQIGADSAEAAEALQRLRATYADRIAYYAQLMNPDGDRNTVMHCETAEQAGRQAIDAQRDMLLRLRDQGVIADDVLRAVEHELDHEESLLLERDR